MDPTSADPRPRRSRAAFLWAGLLAALVAVGLILYRNGTLERWLARDSDNPEELARLREAPPKTAPTAAATAGWPQWMGPLRDGRAPDGALRTDWERNPPRPLWSVPIGGGYSSFAVVGDRVYTQDRQGGNERVMCLDAATGKLVWEHSYAANYGKIGYGSGPRATPTVEGNRVYTVGASGLFLCLEASGSPGEGVKELWRHDLPAEFEASTPQWGFAGSPLIDGDQVVVQPGGEKGAVASFDKSTGALRWSVGSNPAGYSSPVATTVHGVRVIYALTGNEFRCVRSDGELMGSFRWNTSFQGNIATPLVLDDCVFLSSAYNMGCALLRVKPEGDRLKLEPVYTRRNKPLRTHHATAVVRDRFLYGFDGDSRASLICFNYIEGTAVEGWDATGVDKGSIILAGKHLVIFTQTGELVLAEASPDEFRPVAKFATGFGGSENWALPVLLDGRLYLRGRDRLTCLDVK